MDVIIKKVLIFSLILTMVLGNIGCTTLGEGYTKFNIEGFEEFFNIKSNEAKEDYIDSGQLDAFERENVIFIPFIKEISYTECGILLFAYSENSQQKICLDEVTFSMSDGSIISSIDEYGEIEASSKWDSSMLLVSKVPKSEEWFYLGNNLALHIVASIHNGEEWVPTELTYKVFITEYKGPVVLV